MAPSDITTTCDIKNNVKKIIQLINGPHHPLFTLVPFRPSVTPTAANLLFSDTSPLYYCTINSPLILPFFLHHLCTFFFPLTKRKTGGGNK